jgi:hypothetical protein
MGHTSGKQPGSDARLPPYSTDDRPTLYLQSIDHQIHEHPSFFDREDSRSNPENFENHSVNFSITISYLTVYRFHRKTMQSAAQIVIGWRVMGGYGCWDGT